MYYICRKSLLFMRKILFYYSLGATIALIVGVAVLRRALNEVDRLENNQEVLTSEVKLYRTRYDESAASVQSLRVRLDEMRQLHEEDVKRIRDLGIKLRRMIHMLSVAKLVDNNAVDNLKGKQCKKTVKIQVTL